MFSKAFLFCSCLFVLSGCIYNDTPMPLIVHTSAPELILPQVKTPPKPSTKFDKDISSSWLPPSYLEDKSRWRGIVIHHSAVPYGCAEHEDKYHKSLGWEGLGYHFVINNGIFKKGYGRPDGMVEVGYRWRQQKQGSHCRLENDRSNYYNKHTIGICLIGNFNKTRLTKLQWRSLAKLVHFLQKRYNIQTSQIKGHRDIKPTDCPGKYFLFAEFRRWLARYK